MNKKTMEEVASLMVDDIVEKAYPGAQSWAPFELPQTTGQIGVGQLPTYGIGVLDKDGAFVSILPPPGAPPGWPFDYEKVHAPTLKAFSDANADDLTAMQGGGPGAAARQREKKMLDAVPGLGNLPPSGPGSLVTPPARAQ